jgi:hypothetical protein
MDLVAALLDLSRGPIFMSGKLAFDEEGRVGVGAGFARVAFFIREGADSQAAVVVGEGQVTDVVSPTLALLLVEASSPIPGASSLGKMCSIELGLGRAFRASQVSWTGRPPAR